MIPAGQVRMSSLGYEKVEPNEDEDGDEEFANQWEVAELAEGGEEEKDDSAIHEFSSVREKVGHMVALSLPVCASFFLYSLSGFILMYFAGNLDDEDVGSSGSSGKVAEEIINETSESAGTVIFAGISLANMYANVTGFAFLTGMSTAVETMASQHNGAKRYEEVGVTLLRSVLVLGLLGLPIAALWLWVEDLCLLLPGVGLNPRLCAVMRHFLRIRVWSLPAEVFNISFSKYLMAMGVMRPAMFTALLTSVVLAVGCSVVTAASSSAGGGDFRGLAWAYVVAMYAQMGALVLVSWKLEEVQRTLRPLFALPAGSFRAMLDLQELGAFMALGVPGCAMICSEWWAFEILTMFASRLGAVAVSAQSIMLQLVVLAFMFPLGVGLATSSMVGNALGAKKKQLAIQLSKISLGLVFCLEFGVVSPLILWKGPSFVSLFTRDPAVVVLAASSVHWLAFLVLGDGMQTVASGVLRGAGRQLTGAVTNLVCYYCMGLPAAWILCFQGNMGIGGLLLGISIGAGSQALVLSGLVLVCETWIFAYEVRITDSNNTGGVSGSADAEEVCLSTREVELIQLLEHTGGLGESYPIKNGELGDVDGL